MRSCSVSHSTPISSSSPCALAGRRPGAYTPSFAGSIFRLAVRVVARRPTWSLLDGSSLAVCLRFLQCRQLQAQSSASRCRRRQRRVQTWRIPAGSAASPPHGQRGRRPRRRTAQGRSRRAQPSAARPRDQGARRRLPNDAGQEWRDYDISPYTLRVTTTNRPNKPSSIGSCARPVTKPGTASRSGMLDRQPAHAARLSHARNAHRRRRHRRSLRQQRGRDASLRRARDHARQSRTGGPSAHAMLQAVPVQSQGAPGLAAGQRRRLVAAGRSCAGEATFASTARRICWSTTASRPWFRYCGRRTTCATSRSNATAWPGYTPEQAQIDEGFSLEFNPLLSVDGHTIDAVLKVPRRPDRKDGAVMVDVPTPAAPRQRTKIEVPQMSSVRLHEQFRWPVDHVLLVSLGVVASPTPVDDQRAGNCRWSLNNSGARSDLLLFVENRGKTHRDRQPCRRPQPAKPRSIKDDIKKATGDRLQERGAYDLGL